MRSFVTLSDIMIKRFYTIIPFDPIESTGGEPLEKISSLIKIGKQKTSELSEEKFQEYKNQLLQRTKHIILSLAHVGIKAAMLKTEELIELYYNLYNPEEYEPHAIQ